MDQLKDKEEGAYEREDESDQKLNFLRQELHTKEADAEEKERKVNNLERYKEKIEAEIDDTNRMIAEKYEEMDSLQELTENI